MTRVNGRLNPSKNGNGNHPASTETTIPALHRLGEVRRQEHISRRTIARHLQIPVSDVKSQERETADIPLSILYKWQEVLGVPVVELLTEPGDSLSPPLMQRASLVRLMKTALSISERSEETPVKYLAQTMISQLLEIMPELHEINSWHVVGPRRRRDEYGRAVERALPDEVFMDYEK